MATTPASYVGEGPGAKLTRQSRATIRRPKIAELTKGNGVSSGAIGAELAGGMLARKRAADDCRGTARQARQGLRNSRGVRPKTPSN